MAQRRQALFVQGLDAAEGISKEGGIRKLVYKTSCATRGIYNIKMIEIRTHRCHRFPIKVGFKNYPCVKCVIGRKKKHRCEITLEVEPDSKV